METLKVGDSAMLTTSTGYSYSVIIEEINEKGWVCRRVGGKSVKHHCARPNKQPWPKCCPEAFAAISKEMEELYFREKLNL
jgi:hypothetical protein